MRKWFFVFLILFCYGSVFATTIARVKTWGTRETLSANDLNAEFDNVINFLNGSITLVNIDSTIRYRMDTLDVNYGLRFGTGTPAATSGNVFWGNGSLFISVSRDSAGIVTKTGTQSIAGKKTFTDSTLLTGPMMVSGEGTITNHVWFYILPKAADSLLVPSVRNQFVTKFWIDSLRTQFEGEMYDSAAAVVTVNNGIIRPEFADSARRFVKDTLLLFFPIVQNTIEDSLNNNIRNAALLTFTGDRVRVQDTLEVQKILDADTLYSSTTINFFKDNVTIADTLTVNKIADIDTLLSSLNKIYVKTALQVKDSILVGTANILDVISDSIAAHPAGADVIDSVGYSFVIGRSGAVNYLLSGADSANLKIALDTAFVKLAANGGTIFIKGGVYAKAGTDTLRSSTKRIVIKGEPGRTIIYCTGADYEFFDTLNVGKLWIEDGIEWDGTGASLGLIRTGTTALTSGDSVLVKDNIFRNFSSTSATMFATDDSTNAWRIEHNIFRNCYMTKFSGLESKISDNENTAAGRYGFSVNLGYNQVTGNTIVDFDSCGVYLEKFETPDQYRQPSVVSGNYIYRTAKKLTAFGIIIQGSANHVAPAVIANNIIGGHDTNYNTDSLGTGIYINESLSDVHGNTIKLVVTGVTLTSRGDNVSVANNIFRTCTTGISILTGATKSGHSENWFQGVDTNVSDAGTTTVNGDTRDLD